MKEINRFTVADTGREMYYLEPFFSLNATDNIKFNKTLSDMIPVPEKGGRITFLLDDDEKTLYLTTTEDEGGFAVKKGEYGIINLGTKTLGRWLRQHYKLKKGQPYRVGVGTHPEPNQDREMYRLATPKEYKGTNK